MGGIGINADVISSKRRVTINLMLEKHKSVEDIVKVFDKEARKAEKKGDTKVAQSSRELSEFIGQINNEAIKFAPGKDNNSKNLRTRFFKEVLNASVDDPKGNAISKLDIDELHGGDGIISANEINNRMETVKNSPLFSGLVVESLTKTKGSEQKATPEAKSDYPTYNNYPLYDENFNVLGHTKLKPRSQLRD